MTIKDLLHQGVQIVERVLAGEHRVVTRSGHAVAASRPTSREPLEAGVLEEPGQEQSVKRYK